VSEAVLRIDSATGIDVEVPIAGVGARAYAFAIDYALSTAAATAWFFASSWIYNQLTDVAKGVDSPSDPSLPWVLLVALPAAVLYFLYNLLFELATRGSTPGKRFAGIRVATPDGGTPSAGSVFVRNVFRVIDSLPLFYVVGLVTVFSSARSVRIGDLAANTLLIYTPRSVVMNTELDATRELADELLARWPSLANNERVRLAQRLLATTPERASANASVESELLASLRRLTEAAT
jgi:uncharacterized RDD family membrane protein YckC